MPQLDFDKITFAVSEVDREQIEKLKFRFHCKTDNTLFHRLIWFFDDFHRSVCDCQNSINDLRSALYECLGILTK